MTTRQTTWRLSARAERDLERIWLKTVMTWSRQQANDYVGSIFRTLDLLALAPQSGRRAPDIGDGLWIKPCRSHSLWYRIDGKNRVVVVRILHARMDPDRHV